MQLKFLTFPMYYKKVYSVNTELNKVTGIQKVLLDIHHAVKDEYEAFIVGKHPFAELNPELGIRNDEYIQCRSPFMFRNSIVIIHERKLLLWFWLLNFLLFQHIKIVYVHHSLLFGHKLLTKLPKSIVAISDSGIKNLIDYFHADPRSITKIHNCVIDCGYSAHKCYSKEKITILYPARINKGKRQIEIVDKLRGRIDERITILFAGDGPCYNGFHEKVKNDHQFVSLGYRNDVIKLLQSCDYMMLFSTHEGLPITLIEATMCGTPIICNAVGGNEEIAKNGKNAFVSPAPDDYEWLVHTLNNLPNVSEDKYLSMSKRSREIYEKYFTFDIFKQKYLALLKSL